MLFQGSKTAEWGHQEQALGIPVMWSFPKKGVAGLGQTERDALAVTPSRHIRLERPQALGMRQLIAISEQAEPFVPLASHIDENTARRARCTKTF